jgi:hypothetical protein
LRRYYRITESGTSALTAEARRQAGNAQTASRRLRVRLTELPDGLAQVGGLA